MEKLEKQIEKSRRIIATMKPQQIESTKADLRKNGYKVDTQEEFETAYATFYTTGKSVISLIMVIVAIAMLIVAVSMCI
jgi:hypothetical protein